MRVDGGGDSDSGPHGKGNFGMPVTEAQTKGILDSIHLLSTQPKVGRFSSNTNQNQTL